MALSLPTYTWVVAVSRSIFNRRYRLRKTSGYTLTTGEIIIVLGMILFFSGKISSSSIAKTFLFFALILFPSVITLGPQVSSNKYLLYEEKNRSQCLHCFFSLIIGRT